MIGKFFVLLFIWASYAKGIVPVRTSFLVLLVDDWGYGDVGYLNDFNALTRTVHLDEMAAASSTIQLNRFYSESECTPSRVAIMTGRSPSRDCYAERPTQPFIPVNSASVARVARENGYKTAIFGKFPRAKVSVLGEAPSVFGYDRYVIENGGLPTYDAPCFCQKRKLVKNCFYGHYGNKLYQNTKGKTDAKLECDMRENPLARKYALPRYKTDAQILVGLFHEFLANLTENDAFYAQLSFRSAHVPYIGSPELRASCLLDFTNNSICQSLKPKKDAQVDYAANIASVDQSVGIIRKLLRTLRPNTFNHTLVVFLSDNGPELPEFDGAGSAGKLKGQKRSLYEGGVRVPALLEWPARIRKNGKSEGVVSILDLPTTFEYIMLVENDKALNTGIIRDGVSLLSLIDNPASYVRGRILHICRNIDWMDVAAGIICPEIASITERWKTITSFVAPSLKLKPMEYYDLTNDPMEKTNAFPRLRRQDFFNRILQDVTTWTNQIFRNEQAQLKSCFKKIYVPPKV